jgi:Uncharacterised nucleotidyltransferase
MLGIRHINRGLPEAMIAAFREDDRDVHRERLGGFPARDWRRHMHWLDTSGLALYLLHRVCFLRLEECVPIEVLGQLRQRLTDNQLRSKDLFDEFAIINRRFQEAGLRYINLKGFSLVPEYCPDPSFRYQLDLDFLTSLSDAPQCCAILESLGYVANRSDDDVWEFNTGIEHVPSIRDLYKPKLRRSVEVHFAISLREKVSDLLARSRIRSLNGLEFPVLSEADLLLAQALHLFKHFASEWTRISWLLEFRTFVAARRNNPSLWREVRELATRVPQGVLGLGVVTWLGTKAFGEFAPPDLTEWTEDVLPRPIRLWLEHYGRTALLTDFPGTKLYLLLKSELSTDPNPQREMTRKKLFPLHLAPRVAYVARGSMGSRVRALIDQLRFVGFRLRFHAAQSSRYLVEAQRWKRVVNSSSG